jgi:hypothetical protein
MTRIRVIFVVSLAAVAGGCAQSTAGQARSAPSSFSSLQKFAVSGTPQRLDFFSSVNPDCTLKGLPVVRLSAAAQYGRITIDEDDGYPTFPMNSPYAPCNRQRIRGLAVSYVSNAGYTGSDSASVESIFPGGNYKAVRYSIVVK